MNLLRLQCQIDEKLPGGWHGIGTVRLAELVKDWAERVLPYALSFKTETKLEGGDRIVITGCGQSNLVEVSYYYGPNLLDQITLEVGE